MCVFGESNTREQSTYKTIWFVIWDPASSQQVNTDLSLVTVCSLYSPTVLQYNQHTYYNVQQLQQLQQSHGTIRGDFLPDHAGAGLGGQRMSHPLPSPGRQIVSPARNIQPCHPHLLSPGPGWPSVPLSLCPTTYTPPSIQFCNLYSASLPACLPY